MSDKLSGVPVVLRGWEETYRNPWWVMKTDGKWNFLTSSTGRAAVAIFVVDIYGKVLLVENPRLAVGRTCLELPRGGIDPGETAEQAAVRECWEETGVHITADELIPMGIIYPDTGILNHQGLLYAVHLKTPFPDLKAEDEDEIAGHRTVSLLELKRMISIGEINDSFTIVAESRFSLQAPKRPEVMIEIVDSDAKVVASLVTNDPDTSYDEYCRNRVSTGWSWRSAE